LLGRGGMGSVYEAEDVGSGRRVAIKLLTDWHAADDGARRRFQREAAAVVRLQHPNVVTCHETGLAGDLPYLVLELIRGGSAADLLASRGRLPWPEATALARDACRGLAAAHA